MPSHTAGVASRLPVPTLKVHTRRGALGLARSKRRSRPSLDATINWLSTITGDDHEPWLRVYTQSSTPVSWSTAIRFPLWVTAYITPSPRAGVDHNPPLAGDSVSENMPQTQGSSGLYGS